MKIVTIFIDIAIGLFLLAVMLPIAIGAISPMTKAETWGFEPGGDKTMKQLSGESPSYSQDTLSAAEIVLTTRVASRPSVQTNEWLLPDGTKITIDEDYRLYRGRFTEFAQNAVSAGDSYRFVYSYPAKAWMLVRPV
jgi:hypothetical protein